MTTRIFVIFIHLHILPLFKVCKECFQAKAFQPQSNTEISVLCERQCKSQFSLIEIKQILADKGAVTI